MEVVIEDGLSVRELLYLLCQTLVLVMVSFIHPWLAPSIDERQKSRMRKSHVLTFLFVFAAAFSYTNGIRQSLLIAVLFFYVKSLLVKAYA